jgi:hypothetical protein
MEKTPEIRATKLTYTKYGGARGEVYVNKHDMFEYLDIMKDFKDKHNRNELKLISEVEVIYDKDKNRWVEV